MPLHASQSRHGNVVGKDTWESVDLRSSSGRLPCGALQEKQTRSPEARLRCARRAIFHCSLPTRFLGLGMGFKAQCEAALQARHKELAKIDNRRKFGA